MYPLCESLATSASWVTWRRGAPGCQNRSYTSSSLRNTPSPMQFTLIFPDNWFSRNGNAADNLFELPYALSRPHSFPSDPIIILPVLKKQLYAVFESYIYHSTIPIYYSIYPFRKVSFNHAEKNWCIPFPPPPIDLHLST